MKIAATPNAAVDAAGSSTASAQATDPTRTRVVRSLVVNGPATAATLADRLGLTPGAVRRHLDALLERGAVLATDEAPYGPRAPRGRGRPAKVYAVTERGRAEGGPSDDLAIDVLRYLRRTQGEAAVQAFAADRFSGARARFATALRDVPDNERPRALAALLTDEGYAASLDEVPGPLPGVQICQHHCPVAHVVGEFPELCEAEATMFGEVLGTHVQRLATLAHGDGVCTTHLPGARPTLPAIAKSPSAARSITAPSTSAAAASQYQVRSTR